MLQGRGPVAVYEQWAVLPPGFEHFAGVDGPSSKAHFQLGTTEIGECVNSLEVGNEEDHYSSISLGSSSELAAMVSQTPLSGTDPTLLSGAIEIVLPFEEELVEAQKSWNIGKDLGLKVSNEVAMVDALAKIKECQDFSLPRKRGRQRKKKDIPKLVSFSGFGLLAW